MTIDFKPHCSLLYLLPFATTMNEKIKNIFFKDEVIFLLQVEKILKFFWGKLKLLWIFFFKMRKMILMIAYKKGKA